MNLAIFTGTAAGEFITPAVGAGDDIFIWNPGDGSGTVDGGSGTDTLDFHGSGANENIDLSANGDRLRLIRDVAAVTLDIDNVERVIFHALGGSDSITVGDLSGTDVSQVTINLEGSIGSGTGDAQADTVTLHGSDTADPINITGTGTNVAVSGLPAGVVISAVEASDQLVLFASGGNDTISATGLATAIRLTIDAGTGNDIVTGGSSADVIFGNDGNDTVTGGQGADVALLGAGSDRFIWNPGDGSDTIEGQGQTDTLEFNGSNANENITLSANGARSRLYRDVAAVTMDMDDVETLVLNALGGANHFTVADMTGTDLVGPIAYVGGASTDVVDASPAFNDMVVTGGGGADSLTGGRGDDVFRYLAGSEAEAGEIVSGGIGIGDTIQLVNTGAIDFRTSTLSGIERLQFLSGNSSARFGASQIGGSGIERVFGSGGNDALIVTGDAVDLSALLFSGWNDAIDKVTLVGSGAASRLIGTARGDVLNGGAGADTMVGGTGNDIFFADNAADKVIEEAGGGSDSVLTRVSYALGRAQHIELLGTTSVAGTGAINLTGNELVQRIIGNNGANAISGLGGNDTLFGYGGNDTLNGGAGADTMVGGLGNDRFLVDNVGDKVFEAAGQGADIVYASVSYALTAGQHIETLATTAVAGTGAINLSGNALAQRIIGNNGVNGLYGNGGNDALYGYGGNDMLAGGAGKDTLTGGAGNDFFVFNTALNAATNVDRITDFSVPADTIRLDNAVMAGLGAALGTLAPGKFWKSASGLAHDADDRIIYETDTGRLFYDANGSAAGGAVYFATLAPNLALTHADFQVV